ncbi:hypothetical protein ONA91_32675 [Micromonospora sp. DR5-3]|uniref:hypothetical protein n=1 Tax=unclassified Micromonospora TaxID=2617518 RepID=UPI0011DA2A08|nr:MULTISPECIES: hypothetical protein [unclassified Micromonospora]MCW3819207.1 hypothetical protein [Micromonospora sp. DR5-3]TYC20737.1 hypothetical protein FXF52_29700 [Micromonospora sp. MP36]
MLMRGMLISFSDPNIGLVPTAVPFQYNPAEITRTITVAAGVAGGPALRVPNAPVEAYTLKIELDAVDAVDKPISGLMGVQPMLATIEAMMEPADNLGVLGAIGTLSGAVSALTGGSASGGPIPAPSLPLVVLAWSLTRIVPVRITSFSAHETGFNAGLLPVQASVDLGLTVLRPSDLDSGLKMAGFLAQAYQATRSTLAVAGVAQGVELML